MGLTLTWLSVIILIPLAGLFLKASELSLDQFWGILASRCQSGVDEIELKAIGKTLTPTLSRRTGRGSKSAGEDEIEKEYVARGMRLRR